MKQKNIEVLDDKVNDLGRVIYQAISDEGLEILLSRGRITGFLLDIAQGTSLKRKIKIFSNMFKDDYLRIYQKAFDMELSEAENMMKRLERKFVDEEGLSEEWARVLCEDCLMAVKYYKGIAAECVMPVENIKVKISGGNDKTDFVDEKIDDNDDCIITFEKTSEMFNEYRWHTPKEDASSAAFKISQNTNENEKLIETSVDCLRAVDQCFAKYDGGYRSIMSEIVDCISSKKDFGIAYKVLKKIDKLDLDTSIKFEMAMYFIEKMEIVIQEEIHPVSWGIIFWKSDTWGKGFQNDDYVKYCKIAFKYKRRGGK